MTLPPGPGPFKVVRSQMYGKPFTFLACQCPACIEARRALERARRMRRDAKRALRSHHRRPRVKAKAAATPQEYAARVLARHEARTPCERCGKVPGGHRVCGVANVATLGPAARAAHGRRVATGKALIRRRQRAAHAAPEGDAAAQPSQPDEGDR
jgi:hypothetical protein